jgi:hypothetical protein
MSEGEVRLKKQMESQVLELLLARMESVQEKMDAKQAKKNTEKTRKPGEKRWLPCKEKWTPIRNPGCKKKKSRPQWTAVLRRHNKRSS